MERETAETLAGDWLAGLLGHEVTAREKKFLARKLEWLWEGAWEEGRDAGVAHLTAGTRALVKMPKVAAELPGRV